METTAGERVHGVLATRSRPWVEHLGALGLYVGIMLALFGPKILPHLSDHLLAGAIDRGSINDASIYVWNLSWWPHAIGHAMNPFYTMAMWAPTGINLAGTTVIPLPSLVIAPVTLFFGPIVSFNLLSLLAPPTAAWTAYLLCRRIDAGFLPSVAGGFFFGFSSYEWLQTGGGHLNLSEIVFVPVCAYLVVRRLEGTIGPRAFTAGLTAALVAQFAISAEVFATMTIAGVLFGAIALVLNTRERRVQWYRTALLMVLSYLLALVVLSPYLYSLIARTQPVKPFPSLASWEARAPQLGSSLRQFVVPGPLTQIAHGLGERLGVVPSAWYLGIPLLAVVAVCFWRERRRTSTKILAITFAALIVLSLGPAVRVGGIQILLPWALAFHVPLIHEAIPGRFILYALLIACVAVARWLATHPSPVAWGAVTVAGVLVLPAITYGGWVAPVHTPPFFDSGGYRRSIAPGETVVIVTPYREKGLKSIWQARTGFAFRIAGGFLGLHPPDYRGLRIQRRLVRGQIRSRDGPAIRSFLHEKGVGAVVVFDGPRPVIDRLAQILSTTPTRTGGVVVFDLARSAVPP